MLANRVDLAKHQGTYPGSSKDNAREEVLVAFLIAHVDNYCTAVLYPAQLQYRVFGG